MVQTRKEQTWGSDVDARIENVMREVDRLPHTAIPTVLRRIADRMDRQEAADEDGSYEASPRLRREAISEISPYQTLKAQGGPFAEMIALLEKEQLTDDEARHLRELGHGQAVGLLADWRPAPSDEDVERVLDQRLIERYGR